MSPERPIEFGQHLFARQPDIREPARVFREFTQSLALLRSFDKAQERGKQS
jgi:hypothetical protein